MNLESRLMPIIAPSTEGARFLGVMKMTSEKITMDKRITHALYRAWNNAGHDAFLDDEGRPDEGKTLSKEEVVEITLDCQHC